MVNSSWKIARASTKLNHYLELVPIIEVPFPSGPFKPWCTWPGPSWFMFLYILHWSKYGAENLELWGFAVKHAVWIHNWIPNHLSSLTTLGFCTRLRQIMTTFCILINANKSDWNESQSCCFFEPDLRHSLFIQVKFEFLNIMNPNQQLQKFTPSVA